MLTNNSADQFTMGWLFTQSIKPETKHGTLPSVDCHYLPILQCVLFLFCLFISVNNSAVTQDKCLACSDNRGIPYYGNFKSNISLQTKMFPKERLFGESEIINSVLVDDGRTLFILCISFS